MRRVPALLAALALLATTACGDSSDAPTPTPTVDSGISGVASVGPACPVVRADSPCPDRPFEGVIVVREADGAEVARTVTDAEGRFTVALPPGDYVVASEVMGPFPVPAELEVSVRAGEYASVHVQLDSGIR